MSLKALMVGLVTLLVAETAVAEEPGAGSADLQKCKICHSLDKGGPNRVGPNLSGIFGSKAGTVAGFRYSEEMRTSGIVWDDETLAKFLRDPRGTIPGNHMSFPGIQDEAVLTDLLRQLKQATQ